MPPLVADLSLYDQQVGLTVQPTCIVSQHLIVVQTSVSR